MSECSFDRFVGVFDGFFSQDECNEAIRRFEICQQNGLTFSRQFADSASPLDKKDQSLFFDEARYSDKIEGGMIGSDLHNEFLRRFWQDAYPKYQQEYDVLRISGKHSIYQLKIQKTEPSGGYHVWHYESSERDSCQRLLSFILYLNDVEDGGETEFLYQQKRVKPKQGTMIIFPASFTHTHRGNPPLTGGKYILTGWVEF